MAREFAKAFYDSRPWRECREAYRRYRGGLCERCLKQGLVKAGDIVHHKVRLTPQNINDPKITLNFTNLELVCLDCHNKEHFKSARRYGFDRNGNVTIPPVGK